MQRWPGKGQLPKDRDVQNREEELNGATVSAAKARSVAFVTTTSFLSKHEDASGDAIISSHVSKDDPAPSAEMERQARTLQKEETHMGHTEESLFTCQRTAGDVGTGLKRVGTKLAEIPHREFRKAERGWTGWDAREEPGKPLQGVEADEGAQWQLQ